MTLAIDASTPAMKGGASGAANTLASNTFSPPAGSLLVLLIAAGDNATAVSSITDSLGSHLTYTKLAASTANATDAEVWIAACPSAQTNMTVTVTWASNIITRSAVVGVAVVTGAAATQNGATKTATSTSGTPSAAITSLVGSNSLILGVVANFTSATGPTIPAGQSDSFNGNTYLITDATDGTADWGQRLTGMNLAAGAAATINDTAPTGIQYGMAIAEILASGVVAAKPPQLMMTGIGA